MFENFQYEDLYERPEIVEIQSYLTKSEEFKGLIEKQLAQEQKPLDKT